MARLSWPARLYIAAVTIVAATAIALGPFGDLAWWRDVAVLGLLLVIFESSATLLRPRQLAWSPNSSATLAAAVLLGPVGAGLVGACTMFGVRRGLSLAQRAFNTGMMSLSAYLAGLSSPGIISSSFTWEKVETLDYGVDFGLFGNRLTGTNINVVIKVITALVLSRFPEGSSLKPANL